MIPKDLNIDHISKVYKNLSKYVIKTPLIEGWSLINDILDTNTFFKLEFLQNAGTFKNRGATNNILNLDDDTLKKGITAVSAGNHAIAASYVANKFNLKNKIFIYKSANKYRIDKNIGIPNTLFRQNLSSISVIGLLFVV